jgi:hypothetical protein
MPESTDIRQTEERLRNYLDQNQVFQERMCLTLLPLLGPFTAERPRRPKGGPDGGRDIEAVREGTLAVWGAVGFKNGGGADASSRGWVTRKFKADLDRALKENPDLPGFVFFTNVDLTLGQKEKLTRHAHELRLKFVEIYDLERLRHVLDSPEGLLARLQYLDIPMSATEQAALVGKFGGQLQNAVTARFDRVEQTLARMDQFLDLQKPIYRLDLYAALTSPRTSAQIGEGAMCITIEGLQDLRKSVTVFCTNDTRHPLTEQRLVMRPHLWISERPEELVSLMPTQSSNPRLMCAYSELSLTAVGRRVSLADATSIHFKACCTDKLRPLVKALAIDVNGYELFSAIPDAADPSGTPPVPKDLPFQCDAHQWVTLLKPRERITLFEPYRRSSRFLPLRRTGPGT